MEIEKTKQKEETERKVKVEYPEIREILRKLYSCAYNSGKDTREEKPEGYDWSTAYKEIAEIIKRKVLKSQKIT